MDTRMCRGAGFGILFTLACSGATGPDISGGASGTGGATNTCPTGAERCACYGNHTCDSGLECRSDLCVAGASGGASAIGGSTNAAGAIAAATGGTYLTTGGVATLGGGPNLTGTKTQPATGGAAAAIGGVSGFGGASTAGTISTLPTTGGARGTGGSKTTGGAPVTGGMPNAGGTVSGSTSTTVTDDLVVITNGMWDEINSPACTAWAGDAETVPSNIEFVVDTSGSMMDVAANTTDGRSKWEILRSALSVTFDGLPELTSVGLLLWPNRMTIPNTDTTPYLNPGGVSWCVNTDAAIPLERLGPTGSLQRESLRESLEACTPTGGTPMADAYNYAMEQAYGNPFLMPGAKYAVLITDGQPTIQLGCMGTGEEKRPVDFQPVIDAIEGARDAYGIRTSLVGLPGSEHQSLTGFDGRALLSAAAQAGGTPLSSTCRDSGPDYCHFDVSIAPDFGAALQSALQSITEQAVSCRYRIRDEVLQGQSVDPNHLNVVYQVTGSRLPAEMRLVPRASDSSCAKAGGWFLDSSDPAGKTIQFCPSTCKVVQKDSAGLIALMGGCATIVP